MTRKHAAVALGVISLLVLFMLPSARTQTVSSVGGIEVTADQLEYEADKKLLTGRGNVLVKYGQETLRADFMTVQTDTQEAHAIGNVVYDREGNVWRGEEIHYNFKTRQGDFGEFTSFMDPYHIRAKDSRRTSPNEFVLKNATITTCDGPHPEYRIRAREARIRDEKELTARGVVFFLGPIPIFYVPKWTKQLHGDGADIDFVPGYSSRMGPYLLTAYNYRLNDVFKAATHVDYRQKRGFGVGQDLLWGDPRLPYRGALKGYYTKDRAPLEGRSDEEIDQFGELIEEQRYRLRLSDVRYFTPRDYMITELNYVSDPGIIEDFFNREFRDNAQPENRISLTHRDDNFTAGLQINKRLNDFYENVDRVPEASLYVPRLRLGESPFYYESANTAAQLEKVFPEKSGAESYDAFRVDSGHTIYYPTRHFGFLNFIPRAGYRATYYSKTYGETTQTNVISTVDTNDEVSITNQIVTIREDKGSDIRSVLEAGFEVSFKGFSVWHNEPLMIGRDDRGLRHVVEPYLRHTYIPEPSVLPEALPQFDEVDTIGETHDVRVGVRNKFQTKRRARIHDLLDLDVWTTYRIEKAEGQEDFSDVFFDGSLRLSEWWMLDADGSYDTYEGEVSTFNSQLGFFLREDTRLSLEYRYQRDRRDQVAGEVVLFPNRRWSFSVYERYSFEDSKLEEQSYFVQHKGQCLGYGAGFKKLDEDVQFWLQFWLIAFPKTSIELGM